MPAPRPPALRIASPVRGYTNATLTAALSAGHLPEGSRLEAVDPAGMSMPVQVEVDAGTATLHWVQPHLAPGQSTTLTLRPAERDATRGVLLTPGDGRIDVHVGDEHFTSYHHDPAWAKPFLHPLLGPSGPVRPPRLPPAHAKWCSVTRRRAACARCASPRPWTHRAPGGIENAYGAIDDRECWGRRAPWYDYAGPVGGQTVGIAIFDHPANLRHPTCWHVRNYGLMTAKPSASATSAARRAAPGALCRRH